MTPPTWFCSGRGSTRSSPPSLEPNALRGDRIVKIGTTAEVRALVRDGHTRVLDLEGRLVLPGFIDNHVHFAQAGRLLLGLNLLEVDEPVELRRRVGEAAKRLPAGAWLVGGDWGAYGAWAKGSTGADAGGPRPPEFLPTKELIDPVSGDHPALVSRFDGQLHLANTLALRAAGITAATRNPEGGEVVRGKDGSPNGLLRGTAAQLVTKVVPLPDPDRLAVRVDLDRARGPPAASLRHLRRVLDRPIRIGLRVGGLRLRAALFKRPGPRLHCG
jgi:predicted amidohydrolase YtcJ